MNLEEAMLDLTIFKAKYAEAVRHGLLSEEQVYFRWLYN